MLTKIDPKLIRTDLGTQVRVRIDEDVVKEYAAAMEAGDFFPPLLVYFDEPNNRYILVDGFIRLAAHRRLHPNDPIFVSIKPGTLDEARWASLSVNNGHGFRHTNAYKRNSVIQVLKHPKSAELSNRQIGKLAGVDPKTVATIRRELNLSREFPR
jgi:hypothetical protein